MRLTRFLFLMLLIAAGFALIENPQSASALQKDKDELPRKPANYTEVIGYKNAGGIADLAKAKTAFEAFARYAADMIANPKVYSAPQEFKSDTPLYLRPPSLDDIIGELNRHILVPEPGSRVGPNDADYIRELGTALDKALKPLIRNNGEAIVRINATRMLAAACRSGATAHYATVTELISSANTPSEVKYYAFQAAANLLAAYDLNNYETRGHSNTPEVVAALITAIDAAITNPSSLVHLPTPPAGKPAAIPADQMPVVAFIRRQAVRALAQVRFAEFKVRDKPTLRPAFTLARIAMSDPTIIPTPTHPAEVAEAVIGLCNMTPPRLKATEKYTYAITDAVVTGLITFASPRAANPGDKSIPWKGTAARLSDALKGWPPLFDPNFNPQKPTAFAPSLVPKPVAELVGDADRLVLNVIERSEPGARINVDGLRTFRQDLRKAKPWSLAPFLDDPALVLPQKD